MDLQRASEIFDGLLLLVLAAFVGIPAWTRLSRNIFLARKGTKASGHYYGHARVVFSLPEGGQILFSTWSWPLRKCNLGDELPVLYNPARPWQAEVRRTRFLWRTPLANLSWAASSVFLALLFFRQTDTGQALLLFLCSLLCCNVVTRLLVYFVACIYRLLRPAFVRVHSAPGKRRARARCRNRRESVPSGHENTSPEGGPSQRRSESIGRRNVSSRCR